MNRVIVKRDFLGIELQQMHDNKFFCLTDFAKAIDLYYRQRGEIFNKTIADFMKRTDTIELIKAIQDNEEIAEVYIAKKGKGGGTYVHPLLLVEFAMYCNSDFKYKALNWIKDKLCEYRDSSGESYKTLSSVIDKALQLPKGDNKLLTIAIANTANRIKTSLGVEDWNRATEYQLQKRDNIHRDLCLLLEAGVNLNKSLDIVLSKSILESR